MQYMMLELSVGTNAVSNFIAIDKVKMTTHDATLSQFSIKRPSLLDTVSKTANAVETARPSRDNMYMAIFGIFVE
jgi:hypothetical protein